ncbi:hypothetical protein [Nocardia sp. NPDC051981]|uniref:hypothetical protein n=1 Tax=Nocardia sp. NPDC051981 TaxID=3155417 RepID=UPI003414D4B8
MTGEPITTLYDYQLSLLHAMCRSAPAQATDLLERIGATPADTEMAEKRWWWSAASNKFTSIAEYVSAWGAAESEDTYTEGDTWSRRARWDLSFWPGLQMEFTEFSRGPRQVWRRLLRRPEMPRPRIDGITDLTPWSCTTEEFHDSMLGPFAHVDGLGSTGDITAFNATDPDSGHRGIYWARFDWGLLQSVEPAPERYDKYVWRP